MGDICGQWGIHLTQVATRCCGRAKASTKKRIPRLLLWRGVGLRSASDSRSCRPKAATAMNSRVGRLGGHSHDSRNLTFLFRSREATTHRVYLNEVDTPLVGILGENIPSGRTGTLGLRARTRKAISPFEVPDDFTALFHETRFHNSAMTMRCSRGPFGEDMSARMPTRHAESARQCARHGLILAG